MDNGHFATAGDDMGMAQQDINRELSARMKDLSKSLNETNIQLAKMEQLLSGYNKLSERVDKCEDDILVIQTKQKERDGWKTHFREWGSWGLAIIAIVTAWWQTHH